MYLTVGSSLQYCKKIVVTARSSYLYKFFALRIVSLILRFFYRMQFKWITSHCVAPKKWF